MFDFVLRAVVSYGIGKAVDAFTENCDPATRAVARTVVSAVVLSGPDVGDLINEGYVPAIDTYIS